MRKFNVFLMSVFLFATACCECKKAKIHVFSTYYGDIDIDSMEIAFNRDGHAWYLVRQCDKDSFNWDGEWKYLDGPIKDFYCPDLDLYEEEFPDNHGRRIVAEIDPYTMYDWLNN